MINLEKINDKSNIIITVLQSTSVGIERSTCNMKTAAIKKKLINDDIIVISMPATSATSFLLVPQCG